MLGKEITPHILVSVCLRSCHTKSRTHICFNGFSRFFSLFMKIRRSTPRARASSSLCGQSTQQYVYTSSQCNLDGSARGATSSPSPSPPRGSCRLVEMRGLG